MSDPTYDLSPIGTIVPRLVHKQDGGALKVVGYGIIWCVTVEELECVICGERMDVSDYDCVVLESSASALISQKSSDS